VSYHSSSGQKDETRTDSTADSLSQDELPEMCAFSRREHRHNKTRGSCQHNLCVIASIESIANEKAAEKYKEELEGTYPGDVGGLQDRLAVVFFLYTVQFVRQSLNLLFHWKADAAHNSFGRRRMPRCICEISLLSLCH
jgi:hypothetical protein